MQRKNEINLKNDIRKMHNFLILFLTFTFAILNQAQAKPTRISLDEMVGRSEVIIAGSVTEVEQESSIESSESADGLIRITDGFRAKIQVRRNFKGVSATADVCFNIYKVIRADDIWRNTVSIDNAPIPLKGDAYLFFLKKSISLSPGMQSCYMIVHQDAMIKLDFEKETMLKKSTLTELLVR